MTKEIPLSRGYVALVDDEDFERASALKWSAKPCKPRADGTFKVYAIRSRGGTTVYLHRFLLNAPTGVDVDHENGDGLDCRRSNMRMATRSQNIANMPKNGANRSGFKGVSFHKWSGRFQVSIGYERRMHAIGYYDDPEFAAHVYDSAARLLFGQFANTNFPDSNPDAEAIVAARFARDAQKEAA